MKKRTGLSFGPLSSLWLALVVWPPIAVSVSASPVGAQDAGTAVVRQTADAKETSDAGVSSGFFTEVLDVRVVNVEVVVTDRSGVPVVGLGAEDFELKVDGESTAISNFYSGVGERFSRAEKPVDSLPDSAFRTLEEV